MNLFRRNYDLLLGIFNPEGWLDISYPFHSLFYPYHVFWVDRNLTFESSINFFSFYSLDSPPKICGQYTENWERRQGQHLHIREMWRTRNLVSRFWWGEFPALAFKRSQFIYPCNLKHLSFTISGGINFLHWLPSAANLYIHKI